MRNGADVHDRDRFGISLTLALVLHTIFILGVGFSADLTPKEPPLPELDVILIHRNSEQPPEKADFLAQANQQGGGSETEPDRPQSPVSGPSPLRKGLARQPQPTRQPQAQPHRQQPELHTVSPQPDETLNLRHNPPRPKPRTEAGRILSQSLELARLEAEINQDMKRYAKRPRKKFISANTRESLYAAYMQAWVKKVERVGNLNYPDQARRNQLTGSLVVSVSLDANGKVVDIEILQPSGHRILDEATLRIIRLAAPFAPLPEEILRETDILNITRTWQYLPGNRLGSSR